MTPRRKGLSLLAPEKKGLYQMVEDRNSRRNRKKRQSQNQGTSPVPLFQKPTGCWTRSMEIMCIKTLDSICHMASLKTRNGKAAGDD